MSRSIPARHASRRARRAAPLAAGAAARGLAKTPRLTSFRSVVWGYWRENGRHELPWRKTTDPYKILVSEMMLQQTQVSRVLPKYKSFLRKFPTARALAKAPLSAVLKEWSGLGYNRRAKYLHDAAKTSIHNNYPIGYLLCKGVGPYTRAAVKVFAFNEPDVLLETNIRTAFIHHFFPRKRAVTDKKLLPFAAAAARGQDPRTWYWALMDYGTHIKRLHQNPSRRSAHYGVQSKFEGSLRQVRGAILKLLIDGSHGDKALAQKLSFDGKRIRDALHGLALDGLILSEKGSWRIA